MSSGVTDQKATDSPGDGRRASAAATAADRDTDSDADSGAASDDQQKGKVAREQKKAERAERRQTTEEDQASLGDRPRGKGAKQGQELSGQVSAGVSAARNRIASIVWLIAVLCAVILAVGALLAALNDIDEPNSIVEFIYDTAEALDGPFGNIITFEGSDDPTKEVLVSWGLAALAYLIVGRILDRLIRT